MVIRIGKSVIMKDAARGQGLCRHARARSLLSYQLTGRAHESINPVYITCLAAISRKAHAKSIRKEGMNKNKGIDRCLHQRCIALICDS